MSVRTQVTLDPELRSQAREKASALGISFAEYVRRLVARDLKEGGQSAANVSCVFDLGDSGGSDIASQKDEMIGKAVSAVRQD